VHHRSEAAWHQEDESGEDAESRRTRQHPCQVEGVLEAEEVDPRHAPVLRQKEKQEGAKYGKQNKAE